MSRRLGLAVRAGAVLIALAVPAAAEVVVLPPDAPGAADMLAYARTEAYRKLMAQAVARIPASVMARCPKLVVEDGGILIGQPLRLGPDKAPVGGDWRHSRPVHGCGADLLVSFFFFATPERRILTVVGVPGDSHADLTQQRNARSFVLVALQAAAGACGSFETVNTRFGGWGGRGKDAADPGASAPFRPWWETWTMLGCGKRYVVPLEFSPNRLGTAIQPGSVTLG